jgi:MtrB/PioB family decaheme-associated outer membrane protein
MKSILVALLLLAFSASAQTTEPPTTPEATEPAPDTAAAQTTEPPTTPEAAAPASDTAAEPLPQAPGGVFGNYFDLGVGLVSLNPRSSKFLEYRDVPEGLSGPSFRFGTETPSTTIRLSGANLSQDDKYVRAYVDSRLLRADIVYDQIPHRFGFDARSIETRVARDAYGIEDTTQRAFQNTLEATTPRSAINFAFLRALVEPALNTANVFDVELRRDRGSIELQILPEAALDTRITYFQENRRGTRGAGSSFGFGNVVETPEPIDYRTREVGLNAEYPIRNGLVRGMVRMNEFSNALTSYTFDNPFRASDSTDASAYQAPGSASVNGPAFGRLSLPPDNRAVNAAAGILYKLPWNTRLTADVGMGRWTQDDTLVPYATNTAIREAFAGPGGTPTPLPVSTLDGVINTTTLNLQVTSKPLRNTSLTARYRSYDLENDTPRVTIPGYARFDSSWQPNARITVPYSWGSSKAELVASYDLRLGSVEAGFRQERVDRTFRETRETRDNVWHVAGDVRPVSWLIARASYERGRRRFDEYDFERGEDASFVVHPAAPLNLPQLRRFDQANRNSERVSVMLQVTPLDTLTFSVNGSRNLDDYDDHSDYGLLEWQTGSFSIEADYSPTDRLSTFLFASVDEVRGFQRGRQSAGTISVNPLDDWTAENTDEAHTFGGGVTFAIIPERIDLDVSARHQTVDGFADLFSPPGGTPDVAFSIPQVDDTRITTVSAELGYALMTSWELAVGGWLERYRIRDAQTSNSQPYMPGGFFLAENNGDYRGNALYLRATYRF